MRPRVALVVLLASSGVRTASATVKPEVSLRSGYGAPLGGTDTQDLSEHVAAQIPLWLDAGVRVADRFFVGAYAQYSFSFLGEGQASGCRSHDRYVGQVGGGSSACQLDGQRLGVELLYHPRPSERFDPWLGLGTGYEWLTLTEKTRDVTGTTAYGPRNQTLKVVSHGFEFANVQVGMDALLTGRLAVGPFVALTFAKYRSSDGTCHGDCGDVVVVSHRADGDFHQWLYLGLRVTYVF